mmetsp:Transcript_9133/g.17787  ORF Transcript_9133/g.17787 Transcript_9133/m.17787 type:complete len:92 (+) Transcript_9133:418-693(+)
MEILNLEDKQREAKLSAKNCVIKFGPIKKRGVINMKYKDRFMKLERLNGRHFLVYYKNKSDSKHSGQILLEQAQIELDERNKKNWRVITGL